MDAERSRYINGHIVGTKSVEWRVESVQMSEVQMSDPKRIYEVVHQEKPPPLKIGLIELKTCKKSIIRLT